MSFGVDTLGGLVEKLKQLVNDTQTNYESFFDATQLYKQGRMNEKEYFSKMGEYLVSSSALNFLSCRVILELKMAIDKKSAQKTSNTNNRASSFSPSQTTSGVSSGAGGQINTGGGFGVDGFISTGGSLGPNPNEQFDLPMPQEAPTFRPVDIVINKSDSSDFGESRKNCIVCAASIPKHAKFCSKCGNSQ